MVVYETTRIYEDIPAGTKMLFSKSFQHFYSKNDEYIITNNESYHNPGLIKIDKILTLKKKKKEYSWNIGY